jgi:hypothetical protein
MSLLLLIDGEFRSLLRSAFEKIIGSQLKKRKNKYEEILKRITIRVVSSLIAIQVFIKVKDTPMIKNVTSYAMIVIFLYFVMTQK